MVDGGAATGATALRITNQAGPGAKTTGDGIQVVQAINGGTTAPGAFTSGGIYAGAYSYMLFRGGVTPGTEQNWYLRCRPSSIPSRSTGPACRSIPKCRRWRASWRCSRSAPSMTARATRISDRAGCRRLGAHLGRSFSERRDGTVSQSFSGNVFGMQAGQDLYARVGDSGHQDRYGVFLPTATRGDAMGNAATAPASSPSILHSLGGY